MGYLLSVGVKKALAIVLVGVLLLAYVPALQQVSANTPSATRMTTSMVTFFREDRTRLDVRNVSQDEIRVFSVFMSNFFIPGQTTVSDIASDEMAKKISNKFFGSEDNYREIQGITTKIMNSLTVGFVGDAFNLYTDKDRRTRLTGLGLLQLLSMDTKDVYLKHGSKMDFNTQVMRAVVKVLYGFSPELFLHSGTGLQGFGNLFMDGYGNIWGDPIVNGRGSVASDFILILPACLNPYVFNDDGSKFPVTNAFVMGAIPVINNRFFDSEAPVSTPYYLMRDFLRGNIGTGNRELNNFLNIFGITSPANFVGRSDYLSTTEPLNTDSLVAFMTANNPRSVVAENSGIMLSLALDNESKVKMVSDLVTSIPDTALSTTSKNALMRYLNASDFLRLDQLADEMFYFNITGAQSGQASYSGGSNWRGPMDAFISHRLFTNNAQTELHTDSFAVSPFSKFFDNYFDATDKDAFLKDYVASAWKPGWGTLNDSRRNDLRMFLDGRFTGFNHDVHIFDFMSAPHMSTVFNVLPQTGSLPLELWRLDVWIFRIATRELKLSFGLTVNDSQVALESFRTVDELNYGSPGGVVPDVNKFLNFNVYRLFGINRFVATQLSGTASGTVIPPLTQGGRVVTGSTSLANNVNNWAGIYWSYMAQMVDLTTGSIRPRLFLPTLALEAPRGINFGSSETQQGIRGNEQRSEQEMQRSIVRRIYDLLDDGPNQFRDRLVKSTQDSWVVATHRALIGSWSTNITNVTVDGTTAYAAVMGYINTPSLNELPFTAGLLQNYMYLYVFLLLAITAVLVLMVIANLRTWQEALVVFVFMCVALLLPPTLINNTVRITNSINDSIFSNRFNFWALAQHEQSYKTLQTALVGANQMDTLIAQTMGNAVNVYTNDAGVRVKWASPRKSNVFDSLVNTAQGNSGLATNTAVFRWLFSSFVNQEEFVFNDPFAAHLYRPYNALANTAKSAFDNMGNIEFDATRITNEIVKLNATMLGGSSTRFASMNKRFNKVVYSEEQLALIDIVRSIGVGNRSYRMWHLNNDAALRSIFRGISGGDSAVGFPSNLTDKSADMFLLYTESPFYYFYNVLKYNYVSQHMDFKGALLNPSLFRVMELSNSRVTDKTRDFLDLEGLFTYVVPILHQSNEYVQEWTDRYGTSVLGFDFGSAVGSDAAHVERFHAERVRKDNMRRVWTMYSPWVDGLYDLGVHNQRIRVANRRVSVGDALNPGYYDEVGRSMIWSEADMRAKGYQVSDLSDIEFRIQRVLETTRTDMLYLINYRDFEDEVLLTAAAMIATFNFNREFSRNRIIGDSVMLYPQGFELKNFNYDAFLRMTLLNATGEPLMADKDLYVRILDRTSIFTGILLLVKSIIAVILIPSMKLLVLLLLLFLGVLICISCVVNPPEKLSKMLVKSLLTPVFLFALLNVAFAFTVSLFVGEGLTGYVGGRGTSLVTNDPTITLLLLSVIGLVYVISLWHVVKLLIDGFKTYGLSTVFSTIGIVTGAATVLNNAGRQTFSRVLGAAGSKAQDMWSSSGAALRKTGGTGRGASDVDAKQSGSDTGNTADESARTEVKTSNGQSDTAMPVKDTALEKDVEALVSKPKAVGDDGAGGKTKSVVNSPTAVETDGRGSADTKAEVTPKPPKVIETKVGETKSDITNKLASSSKPDTK